MRTPNLFLIIFAGTLFVLCPSMNIIFERVEIHYFNESHIRDVKASVRRYSRRGNYHLNLEGIVLEQWGNNISFDVVLFEYLHNEYKRTFIEFHFDQACEFVNTDPYLGRAVKIALQKLSLSCPIPPGPYILGNLSIPTEAFPYVWPFERAKGVGTVSCDKRKAIIGNGSLYLRFEQKTKKTSRLV